MLEDGDSFVGGWVLLRTGDSYGGSGCWPAGKTTIVMGDYLVQQGHRYGSGWLCASQSCPWITDMYVLVDVGYITQCDNTAIKNITGRHDEARCCVPSLPAAGRQMSFKPRAWP